MPTTVFSENSLCFYGMSGGGRYATVSGKKYKNTKIYLVNITRVPWK